MELYDPVTGTFTAASSLATARVFHTATLLPSGQVLLAGGYNYGLGELSNSGTLGSAELYDPGYWIQLPPQLGGRRLPVPAQVLPTGNLVMARYAHTATLVPYSDGFIEVLIAGGSTGVPSPGTTPFASAELYPTP
jgi:hypothetical protein